MNIDSDPVGRLLVNPALGVSRDRICSKPKEWEVQEERESKGSLK
jgi:hypothetical protein